MGMLPLTVGYTHAGSAAAQASFQQGEQLFSQQNFTGAAGLYVKAAEADRIKRGELVEAAASEDLLDRVADEPVKWQELMDLVTGIVFPNAQAAAGENPSPAA